MLSETAPYEIKNKLGHLHTQDIGAFYCYIICCLKLKQIYLGIPVGPQLVLAVAAPGRGGVTGSDRVCAWRSYWVWPRLGMAERCYWVWAWRCYWVWLRLGVAERCYWACAWWSGVTGSGRASVEGTGAAQYVDAKYVDFIGSVKSNIKVL
jgi:hypothetical protein